MNNNPTYGAFNGNDIMRYLKGEMNPEEMHRLEKASLDDPFLADAIEGYQMNPQVNISDDILELKERVDERARPGNKTIYVWWRMAALLILILGASIAAWWLTKPTNENQTIAKNEVLRPVDGKDKPSDSASQSVPLILPKVQEPTAMDSRKKAEDEFTPVTGGGVSTQDKSQVKLKDAASTLPEKASIQSADGPDKNFKTAPLSPATASAKEMQAEKDDDPVPGYAQKQRGGVATYFFRGRVIDEKNKPLPYASIRISNSNKGTYADVNGYFSIVASDSVLKTEIKSVGFNNKNTDLFAATGLAIIHLDASSTQLNEEVVSSRKAKQPDQQAKKDSRDDQSVTKYAEPACGWALYDIYLGNNLRIPVTQGGATLKGSVTISFFVDPVNGRLYDFRIENSIGILYDKEAIRVLKDGPLWDVFNSEKGIRTSFTVIF